jgi:hypothetical protein
MAAESPDPDVMRRFLLDELPMRERIRIERRFARDPEFFDALRALEEALILDHLRGRLREEWREAFAMSFLGSPARRRRVEELARFLAILPESGSRAERPAAVRDARPAPREPIASPARGTAHTSPVLRWALGAAAMLVVGVAASLLWRPSQVPSMSPSEPAVTGAPPADATPIFDVHPGTRELLNQTNVFRIPGGAAAVRLRIVLTPPAPPAVDATLRPVGGAAVPLPGAALAQENAVGAAVLVDVPSSMLPPGDYLIELIGVAADGRREPLPGRFFSIAP